MSCRTIETSNMRDDSFVPMLGAAGACSLLSAVTVAVAVCAVRRCSLVGPDELQGIPSIGLVIAGKPGEKRRTKGKLAFLGSA